MTPGRRFIGHLDPEGRGLARALRHPSGPGLEGLGQWRRGAGQERSQPARLRRADGREGSGYTARSCVTRAGGRARTPRGGDGGGEEGIKRRRGARRGRRSEALARRGVVALRGRWAGHRAVWGSERARLTRPRHPESEGASS